MRCDSCGALNADSKRFCGDCGAPLAQPELHSPERLIKAHRGRTTTIFVGIAAVCLVCALFCFLGVGSLYNYGSALQTETAVSIAVVSKSTAVPSDSPPATSTPPATPTTAPELTQTPTITSTSTRTPIPRATSKPSATSKATATPKPPSPTHTPVVKGLGVRRSDIQSEFEKLGFEFEDESLSPRNKQPYVHGITAIGDMDIELLGPSDNLSEAIIHALEPVGMYHQGYLFMFLLLAVPDCKDEFTDWFDDVTLKQASRGIKQETKCGRAHVVLYSTPYMGGVQMHLTVEALR